ncbi:MAG: hypothetical protein IT495_11045 [Gammaproteobacteria bacterium]|nr:hypothetical protein [Gammaproteobacteria bacterium]
MTTPAPATLKLFVPGLLGRAHWRAALPGLSRLAALEAVLGRAAVLPAPAAHDRAVFEALGCALDAVPVAALTHHVDFAADHDGAWLRADPVHLHADIDRMVLLDAQMLALDFGEARALVATLNAHLAAERLRIEVGASPLRWYVRLPAVARMRTQAPLELAGRHAGSGLPAGADAGPWLRRGNELQMLLHGHEVNVRRAARGALPVNAVWFWGGGALPAADRLVRPRLIVGTNALTAGLAAWLGVPVDTRATAALAPGTGPAVVDVDAVQTAVHADDVHAWHAALSVLDGTVLAPALRALRAGRLERLTLWDGASTRVLARTGAWKLWRRRALDATM